MILNTNFSIHLKVSLLKIAVYYIEVYMVEHRSFILNPLKLLKSVTPFQVTMTSIFGPTNIYF